MSTQVIIYYESRWYTSQKHNNLLSHHTILTQLTIKVKNTQSLTLYLWRYTLVLYLSIGYNREIVTFGWLFLRSCPIIPSYHHHMPNSWFTKNAQNLQVSFSLDAQSIKPTWARPTHNSHHAHKETNQPIKNIIPWGVSLVKSKIKGFLQTYPLILATRGTSQKPFRTISWNELGDLNMKQLLKA